MSLLLVITHFCCIRWGWCHRYWHRIFYV